MPNDGTRTALVDAQVRGREAERPAALVAGDDRPLDLDRPAEQRARPPRPRRPVRAGGSASTTCPRRSAPGARRLRARRSSSRSPARRLPKRNPAPAATTWAPIADEVLPRELLRLERRDLRRELDDERRPRLPRSASSSSRRSSVASSSTRFPSTVRGCGWNVTTVGTVGRPPASTAARTTARWPRCTPSNVPIATARGSTVELGRRVRATFMPRLPRRHASSASTAVANRSRHAIERSGRQPRERSALTGSEHGVVDAGRLLDRERPDR